MLDSVIATIASEHADTLGLDTATITHRRADSIVNASKAQTTTELLLLLARFHEGVEDKAGAEMLARFASEFATLEATVI